MSSSEALIADIQDEFKKLDTAITTDYLKATTDGLSVEDAKALFEQTVKFQRFLEAKEQHLLIFKGAAYHERTSKKLAGILKLLTTTDTLKEISYTDVLRNRCTDTIEGLVSECRQVVETCKKSTKSSQTEAALSGMQKVIEDMELDLVELYADVRLLTELSIFPVEQRMRVKDELLRHGFREVVEYLESAEQNLVVVPPHLKDALNNSRLALESMLYELIHREGISPVKKFSIDLDELCQKRPDIVDDAAKRLIQGVYSYLSLRGSHAFLSGEGKNASESEFGLGEIYRVLSLLLARLNPKNVRQS